MIITKLIPGLMAVWLLTGCASMVETRVVKEVKYVPVTIDENLLRQCDMAEPPNKDEFLKNKAVRQRNQLVVYVVDLHTNISNCSSRLSEIKALQSKQVQAIESRNGKEQ